MKSFQSENQNSRANRKLLPKSSHEFYLEQKNSLISAQSTTQAENDRHSFQLSKKHPIFPSLSSIPNSYIHELNPRTETRNTQIKNNSYQSRDLISHLFNLHMNFDSECNALDNCKSFSYDNEDYQISRGRLLRISNFDLGFAFQTIFKSNLYFN
jgi:hypothetical protein